MTAISKAILSGTSPEQAREQAAGLGTAPLRDLAAALAADPDLTVSVITYQDGTAELEVLHTGPPHRTPQTTDPRHLLVPARRLPWPPPPTCTMPPALSAPSSATPPPPEPVARTARRVLFVCTANSARSHLAAAPWRQASIVPAGSAGTHPATQIEPGAIEAAQRHRLPMRRRRPRHTGDVRQDGDLIITVCDLAHEELGRQAAMHWSVPDPVLAGDPASFDAALTDLSHRVGYLAPRLAATS